jgi:hypothetical protein
VRACGGMGFLPRYAREEHVARLSDTLTWTADKTQVNCCVPVSVCLCLRFCVPVCRPAGVCPRYCVLSRVHACLSARGYVRACFRV